MTKKLWTVHLDEIFMVSPYLSHSETSFGHSLPLGMDSQRCKVILNKNLNSYDVAEQQCRK